MYTYTNAHTHIRTRYSGTHFHAQTRQRTHGRTHYRTRPHSVFTYDVCSLTGDAYAAEIDSAAFDAIAARYLNEICVLKNSSLFTDTAFCTTVGGSATVATGCSAEAQVSVCEYLFMYAWCVCVCVRVYMCACVPACVSIK